MTRFDRRSLRPGRTITWEYWLLHREDGTLAEPRSLESEGEALECAAGHKAAGMPGKLGISHHLVTEHAGPVEWLEGTLRKSGP